MMRSTLWRHWRAPRGKQVTIPVNPIVAHEVYSYGLLQPEIISRYILGSLSRWCGNLCLPNHHISLHLP